jgi:hypothetical protein
VRHDKSFDKYDKQDLKRLCRKAGVASGEARRKKRLVINNEKLRQQASKEIVHEEVLALRRAAKGLLSASRIDR